MKFLDSALSHSLSIAALTKTGMGAGWYFTVGRGTEIRAKQGLKPTHRGIP